MMDTAKVKSINVKRLSSWGDRLTENHATPVLLLGIGHDHKSGQINVLVTEDMSDAEILLFVKKALDLVVLQFSQNN